MKNSRLQGLASAHASGLAVIAAAWLSLFACADPATESAGVVERGPVGAERYQELVLEGSGSAISAETLGRWGGEVSDQIEQLMDRLAQAAASSEREALDWKTVFRAEMERHPPDVASTLERYRAESARAEDFVRQHDLMTLPDVELKVTETRNPIIRQSFPLALYSNGQLAVTTSATADPDPSYLANHCDVCIPPLAVHEAYPGHHVSFWHLGRVTAESVAEAPHAPPQPNNMFLLEGWALYAEYLMLEHGYYRSVVETLAALRGLLHRALRAEIDAALHLGVMTAMEAERMYVDRLLMTEAAAATEVRRHLAQPTSKATYFVGWLQILDLREQVLDRSPAMPLSRFHDTLLPSEATYPESARRLFGLEIDLVQDFGEGAGPVDWDGLSQALLRELQLENSPRG